MTNNAKHTKTIYLTNKYKMQKTNVNKSTNNSKACTKMQQTYKTNNKNNKT